MATTTKRAVSKRQKRHARIRARLSGTAERPRLAVFKSNQYVYAQLIDDVACRTIAEANTRGSEMSQREQAQEVGKKIAELGKAKKITSVVFDRGGFSYAGIIKELAESARSAGLQF